MGSKGPNYARGEDGKLLISMLTPVEGRLHSLKQEAPHFNEEEFTSC
jgi:hypothetical protein